MTDQGNDSCNIVIKEETEIFGKLTIFRSLNLTLPFKQFLSFFLDYHIQDPEQNREYVLDNINDIKPELIQLSLADLDAQFKTWENFFREQNGMFQLYQLFLYFFTHYQISYFFVLFYYRVTRILYGIKC